MSTFEHVFAALGALAPDFVVAGARQAPDDAALDALAARLGVALPVVYREVARNLGPLVVEARPEVWPDAQPGEEGPAWSSCPGLELYSIAADAPPELDLEQVSQRLRDRTGVARVVVMRRIGERARWRFEPDGRVVRFDPREGDLPGALPEPFAERLVDELEALRRRCDEVKRAVAAHGDRWRAHLDPG